jgi:hypothetical protein
MRTAVFLAAPAAAGLLLGPTTVAAAADSGSSVAFTMSDPRITESSGLAASGLHKGVYWTHNDSDDGPYVYAVDSATGKTVARVTLRGIGTARDVEAISVGPDGDIYVGDIGDNLGGSWPKVWIYKFPEPRTLADTTVTATQYTVQYADGPRDAESLMIDPKSGRPYIASKNEDGGGLYQGPKTLSSSGTNTFRRIDGIPLWITDGAFSPDGTRLVLRGYFGAVEYRWSDGKLGRKVGQLDVPLQPQGESVTFTRDGRALMAGSEGKDSEVWRVPLSGAYLPASDTASDSASASGSSGAGPGSGSDAAAEPSAGNGSSGNVTVGAVAVAAVAALLLLGRRISGRRRRER